MPKFKDNKLNNRNANIAEEKYHYLVNNLSDIVMEAELNGNFTYVSHQAYNILGYYPEEVIGVSGFKFIHPEDLLKVAEAIKNLTNLKKSMSVEYRVFHKNGNIVYISAKGNIVNIEGNTRIVAVLSDITERKKSEQKVKESEEKYRLISENANDLIAVLNNKFEVEYLNTETHKRILGYVIDDEKVLMNLIQIHPDDLDKIITLLKKISDTGEDLTNQIRLKHKNGYYLWFEVKARQFFDENRNQKIMAISRDITERKEMEEKLEKQNKELEKLNTLKSEFLRRSSHELKTPLISIKGFTNLILKLYRKNLDHDIISMLGEINRGCQKLEDIVKNIIDSSQLESGKLELEPSIDNLSFLIKFCVSELQGLANIRNHTIKVDINDKIISKFAKEEIYEVFTNILSNSIKYTPPKGIITIKSELKDDMVIVSIKDNGIGFTEDEKDILFEQFGKIERFGQGLEIEIDGTGLGLHISKKIIELHGGKIWMESEGRNKGSTFYFSLPLIKQ